MSTQSENRSANERKTENAATFKVYPYRRMVQFGFLLLTIWIGIEFIVWVKQLESGLSPTLSRPPGVEVFLPLSALISLKYWLLTGVFNLIHPSGLVIFMIVLATGVLLKKGFCSWVCPFGLLSEYLAKIHIVLFDRIRKIPGWLDYPLRSLKYLLLLFFGGSILFGMNVLRLEQFINSPYNKVADIKMLQFFANMSDVTLWTLVILVLLSILIPYFWCRYLCPYGALLGMISWFSPLKIHRNAESCIDCDKCTNVCPAGIQVHKANAVFSDECNACLECVDACPVKDTLYLSVTKKQWKLSRKAYLFILIGLFVLGTAMAKISGFWQNNISTKEYQYYIKRMNEPVYNHNRGAVPDYEGKSDQSRK
ncbi:MAG TPA: 4Fe-4S binding protein [Bacteroidetes bacterium]|nr:4Fe-4S binding protein [Bacteroidota bacterium]